MAVTRPPSAVCEQTLLVIPKFQCYLPSAQSVLSPLRSASAEQGRKAGGGRVARVTNFIPRAEHSDRLSAINPQL